MTILYFDTETFCETPLKHGVHRYSETVEIMVATWAIDDGPVQTHDFTEDPVIPAGLAEMLADRAVVKVIQNSGFDRTVVRHAWGIEIPPESIEDTMILALSHGLPGGLDKLCVALGVSADQAKDKAGKALIQLFCKPRPKNSKTRRATRFTHPVEWQRFLDYAGSDITAMRVIDRKLPRWNYSIEARTNEGITEHALWCLDQRINDRGVAVDLELAQAALEAVDAEQARLKARTRVLTNEEVQSARQRDAMLKHLLSEYGIELLDLRASTIEAVMQDPELPDPVRELLAIRLAASTSSTTKYKALLNSVSHDGRLRGTLQFCGASRTGRWAGRLFQPQNLPRVPKHLKKQIEPGIAAIKAGSVDLLYDVMELASAAIRGCIVAPPGRKLVVADLANIEGRVLAWLAGEQWKLDAFAGGDDLYVLGYARSFGVSVEDVDADTAAGGTMRLIGKVQELALGYQGAVGAFSSMAGLYGVELSEERVLQIVKGWRKANAEIVSFWYALEKAAIRAVDNPGMMVECRKLRLQRDKAWLRIILPSGRAVCYPGIRVEESGKLTYLGVDQYTRRFGRLKTYGGKLVENVTQALARDVLADAMPRVEAAGFDIVLGVHDELITETLDDAAFTSDRLCELMSTLPAWAEGLPLAASGFEAYRYRKE